jgi:hypothetical protein
MRCSVPYLSYSASTIPGKEEVQPDFECFLSVVRTITIQYSTFTSNDLNIK